MRKATFVIAGIGATLIGINLIAAGPADAAPVGDTSNAFSGPAGDHDSDAFWIDTHNFYTSATTQSQARQMAVNICGDLTSGLSEAHEIMTLKQAGGTLDGSQYVVHAAEWHFCPSYY